MLGTQDSSVKHYGLGTTPGGHRVRTRALSNEARPLSTHMPRSLDAATRPLRDPVDKKIGKKNKCKARKKLKNQFYQNNYYQPFGFDDCYNGPFVGNGPFFTNNYSDCALARQRDSDCRNGALAWQRDNDYRNSAVAAAQQQLNMARQWNSPFLTPTLPPLSLPPPPTTTHPISALPTAAHPISTLSIAAHPISALPAAANPISTISTQGTTSTSVGVVRPEMVKLSFSEAEDWRLLLYVALIFAVVLIVFYLRR